MAALPWKVVIVDESHTMRTTEHPPDAKHTETVASVIKRARRAILLSGTPSLNRPFDLFRQVTPTAILRSFRFCARCRRSSCQAGIHCKNAGPGGAGVCRT